MKKYKWPYTLIVIGGLLLIPACQYDDAEKKDYEEVQSKEQVEEAIQSERVSPEYDENGNPTGEYAQYLWDQQQMEEAMNSLVEDTMQEQYEEEYETHTFPLD